MKKSIVFVNQSSGYLMIDIINAHAQHYDNIVLLTGFLNPRETPLHDKVKVHRLIEYKRSSSVKRLLTWLVFWFQSWYYIFLKYRRAKLYFVSNPPLNAFTASWTKRDFAFLIYDIYPDALAQHRIISNNSWFYKLWHKTNNRVYAKSKYLYTLSEGMKKAMNVSRLYETKVKVVPVWTNNTFFKEIPASKNKFIEKYNLQDKFIVSYSGNLGKTHPVEKIVDLAKNLVEDREICFLIIGEGDKKKFLLQRQNKLKLPNLKILDFQPTSLFPHVLAAAHIGVVTLESDAADLSVPSKTYNLMSAGKPILTIAKETSELAKIIKSNGIGENFSEHEIDEMSAFISSLQHDTQKYSMLKKRSKETSFKYSPENAKLMILN